MGLAVATINTENFDDELYEALRERAKHNQRSIAAEVLALLEEHVPTEEEIEARKAAIRRLDELKFTSTSDTPMPSSLDTIREDRER
jgi:plasmid stability protein